MGSIFLANDSFVFANRIAQREPGMANGHNRGCSSQCEFAFRPQGLALVEVCLAGLRSGKKAIRLGALLVFCAREASGHAAAAPPTSVTNSRLFMTNPKIRRWQLSGSNRYVKGIAAVRVDVSVGSDSDIATLLPDVRSALRSGHRQAAPGCP